MNYKNTKTAKKQKESGRTTLPLLLTITAFAAVGGVWSEVRAAKSETLYMNQLTSVNGQICIGEDGGNYCNVGEDGYKFWVSVFSFANENSGPGAPEDNASTWVSAQEGYGTPGERNIKTGTAFAATLLRGPDKGGLANASNTGEATVTVQEYDDGVVVDEYETSLLYALQTRKTAPPTVTNEKSVDWTGAARSEHDQQIWKNGGNDRPEALEGTLTMILGDQVLVDEEPITSGYVQFRNRLIDFPGNIPGEE